MSIFTREQLLSFIKTIDGIIECCNIIVANNTNSDTVRDAINVLSTMERSKEHYNKQLESLT